MKKMIISLLTAVTIFSTSVQAQETGRVQQKASFGFQGGLNMQKFAGKNPDGETLTNDFVKGGHIGFNLEIPLFRSVYIQPGVQFITKGTKNVQTFSTFTTNLYYVEAPVYIVVKPRVGKGHLIIGVGSEISYGVGGTWKKEDELNPLYNTHGNVKFKKTTTATDDVESSLYLTPWDVTVGMIFGYQFRNSFFIQVNGQYGLMNRIPAYEPGSVFNSADARNIGFGITIGHRI